MATHFSGNPESTGPNKLLIIIPCAILGVLLAVYLGGVVFFYNMFMPGTTLDGQDVSLRSAADVAAEKGDALAGYQTHVTGDGVDLEISSNQIDLAYDGNAYASSAIAETNPWTWPAAIANDRSISVESTVVFDRDALLALFEPFKKESAESVASLGGKVVSFDAERGVFGLDPSITAQYLNDDAIVDALTAGFVAQQPTIELGVEQLSDTDDELHATADAANALLGAAGSTLTLDGETAGELTSDVIAGWVVVSDDLKVSLDNDAAAAWINEAVGNLNTIGSERTFTRADGKKVTVSGGSYGWKVDEAGAAEALLAAVESGTPQVIDVDFESRGQVVPDEGGRDWGNRYIDIDLSEQHVRLYGDDGSVIWESDCVSGDPYQDYDTPTGVNAINGNMQRDATLRGLDYNGDGEPDYISYVSYWMPFVDNLVALHDADWRGSFGGTIYMGNGSHGCVNLPVGKAAELYDMIKVGDVVVTHY